MTEMNTETTESSVATDMNAAGGTTTPPSVQKVLTDIAAWWDQAVQLAKQDKDQLSVTQKLLAVVQAKDVEGLPFIWRDVVADKNQYTACRGTVLDVSDSRTEVHLPYRRLCVALKTYLRLSEGHCLGIEELWEKYQMNPPNPLTKEACLQWIDSVLAATPGIFDRAIAAAEKGEGLLSAAEVAP